MTGIIETTIVALVGGIVSFLFVRLNKKIDKIDDDGEKRHRDQVKVRIAECELLLAEAHISALSARCIRGEKVNGDLEQAEADLNTKKKAVQDITRQLYFEEEE